MQCKSWLDGYDLETAVRVHLPTPHFAPPLDRSRPVHVTLDCLERVHLSGARGPPALELLVVLPAARAEVCERLVLPPHVNAILVRQSSRADGARQQRARIEDLHAGNSIRIYWGSLIRVLSLKAHQDHNSSHTDTSISPPASFLQNNPYTID